MAGFTNTLQGDGLARAQRALAGLEGDRLRLDRRDSGLAILHHYTSNPSGTTTQSASPNPPSREQRLRQEQRMQLGWEREALEPYSQFEHQISDEEKRI